MNLLVHGVPYVYPPELGAPARGVPTAHSGPGLPDELATGTAIVRPYERGSASGISLEPLHRVVPVVAVEDPAFYQAMSLIEVLRAGAGAGAAAGPGRPAGIDRMSDIEHVLDGVVTTSPGLRPRRFSWVGPPSVST